jgi:peptidyl-prolyl cis-trans isomerase C
MMDLPKALSRRASPSGLEYVAMVVNAALDSVSLRDVMTIAGAAILLCAAAEEAVDGPLAMPAPQPALEDVDPVLVEVGTTALRVSDVRAQAIISDKPEATGLPPAALLESGVVEEAADQAALARAARREGLDGALEIRAQLALAERRILSSAYLDLIVSRQVTEDAVRAAYEQLRVEARLQERIELRRLVVSSRDEAERLAERIARGQSFDEMARRQSLDMETRGQGGLVGHVTLGSLPTPFAEAVAELGLGEVSKPIKGEAGWYLVTIDSRTGYRPPPFETVQPRIEQALREQVVAQTVAEARAAVPIRLAFREPERLAAMQATTVAALAW